MRLSNTSFVLTKAKSNTKFAISEDAKTMKKYSKGKMALSMMTGIFFSPFVFQESLEGAGGTPTVAVS